MTPKQPPYACKWADCSSLADTVPELLRHLRLHHLETPDEDPVERFTLGELSWLDGAWYARGDDLVPSQGLGSLIAHKRAQHASHSSDASSSAPSSSFASSQTHPSQLAAPSQSRSSTRAAEPLAGPPAKRIKITTKEASEPSSSNESTLPPPSPAVTRVRPSGRLPPSMAFGQIPGKVSSFRAMHLASASVPIASSPGGSAITAAVTTSSSLHFSFAPSPSPSTFLAPPSLPPTLAPILIPASALSLSTSAVAPEVIPPSFVAVVEKVAAAAPADETIASSSSLGPLPQQEAPPSSPGHMHWDDDLSDDCDLRLSPPLGPQTQSEIDDHRFTAPPGEENESLYKWRVGRAETAQE